MGSPAQQPVYYDTEQGQYYTNNNQQNTVATSGDGQVINNPYANSPNGIGAIFGNMFQQAGMPNKDNPFYATNYANRNYLGNPLANQADRFKTNAQATPYAELTNLFSELNTQARPSSLLTNSDGAMSGANRFLAPSNTSQGK